MSLPQLLFPPEQLQLSVQLCCNTLAIFVRFFFFPFNNSEHISNTKEKHNSPDQKPSPLQPGEGQLCITP